MYVLLCITLKMEGNGTRWINRMDWSEKNANFHKVAMGNV